MNLETAITLRRSARNFKHDPVSDEIIEKMLEAARFAPSGGNAQAHLFGIIKNEETKLALAEAAGGQLWIAKAPVVIACCAKLEQAPEDPSADFGSIVNRLRWGDDFWEYLNAYPDKSRMYTLLANATALIPAEHMILTAVSFGVSACMVGWLDVEAASGILKLPDDIKCMFLLPIGYAAEEPATIQRKSIGEISFSESYC